MSFRVTATVEKISTTGNKYGFILYCGEFREDDITPEEALESAKQRTAELYPNAYKAVFEFEDLPDPRSIH